MKFSVCFKIVENFSQNFQSLNMTMLLVNISIIILAGVSIYLSRMCNNLNKKVSDLELKLKDKE